MGRRWHFDLTEKSRGGAYCPFKKSCLFLNGEAPEKVLAERDYLSERVNHLEGAMDFSTKEIIRLRERIEELEADKNRLQTDLVQALRAPFRKYEKKSPSENQKKRGAPVGHPGWFRKKPDHIDEYVDVSLEHCPFCTDENLTRCAHVTEHIQEDIEDGKVKVTCYRHYYFWCAGCKKIIHGWGENEIPNAAIGPDARAKASFLRYQIKVSYDDTQRVLEYLCGLTIAPGTIVGFDNKLHEKGEPLYEALKETLPHTKYIHADETGWKRDWLWIFTNDQIAFFHIDAHRSADVVKKHLGEVYNGILITDFYSAYRNSIMAFGKQKCCTHLLRDVRELIKKGIPENSDAAVFLNNLKQLIQDAIFLHSQYPYLTPEQWRSGKRAIFKRFKKLYKNPVSHKETETIRKRLVTHKYELFTFLTYPDLVEPTNNRAETGIRNSVLFRKITFGNMTEQGKKNVALIMTIIRTAKLKLLNPIKVLKTILAEGVTPDLRKQFGIPVPSSQSP